MLNITDTSSDVFLQELINLDSMFVRSYMGGRDLISTSYTELHDTRKGSQKIFLRQRPVTSTQNTITVNYRSGIPTAPNWVLYDPNAYLLYQAEGYIHFYGYLPKVHQGLQIIYTAGYLSSYQPQSISSITQVGGVTTVTVASTANMVTGDTVLIAGSSVSADNANQVITVTSSTQFTYPMSTGGSRTLTNANVTDLSAEFDTSRHTLPQDITWAVTQLVARDYNLRYAQGQEMVMTEGQRIQYATEDRPIDEDIRNILDSYKFHHFAV